MTDLRTQGTAPITRFRQQFHRMFESDSGEWVRWDAAMALIREREAQLAKAAAEIAELQARIEAMIRGGDCK